MIPLAATDTEFAGGIVMSLLACAVFLIAIVWIIFPFIVNSQFNALRRLQQETNGLLRYIADRHKEIAEKTAATNQTKPPPIVPKTIPTKNEPEVYRI